MSKDTWTIGDTMAWCRDYLEYHNDESPKLSAEWLLAAATGLTRIELYMHFDQPLTMEERDVLRESLKRRGLGEPLQYISGDAAFRHIVVKTRKGVLIPRPETEVLVDSVLEALAGFDNPRVLEVGTGTGCIACSLAKEAGYKVVATDISPDAVACAQQNVEMLGLGDKICIVQCDCVTGLTDAVQAANDSLAATVNQQADTQQVDAANPEAVLTVDESEFPESVSAAIEQPPTAPAPVFIADGFDCLVSNPPYIPSAELAELPREVIGFEPELALDGGEDGLVFFDRLLEEAVPLLRPGAFFACELHETCVEEAANRLKEANFSNVSIIKDLNGRNRCVNGFL